MPYDPRSIILLNFGDYAREKNGKLKDSLPSIAQIPLMDYGGFPYVDEYLSNPMKTGRIRIGKPDLESIQEVARAFGEFPVRIKCEGAHGSCEKKEVARCLVLPYDRTYNHPEKIKKGGPERINQTHVMHSYFCCEHCADSIEEEKRSGREIEESGIIKLDISFRLPEFLTKKPKKLEWNVNRVELHGKFRKIAYQLTKHGTDDIIDPFSAGKEKAVVTIYAAQDITSRLLGIPEDRLPRSREDYEIPRKLKWHLSDTDMKGQIYLPLSFRS